MEEKNKGCGKRLPIKKRQVRDSLVCNEFQLCDDCSNNIKENPQEMTKEELNNRRLGAMCGMNPYDSAFVKDTSLGVEE